ncbi:MAG: TonB-dependent receptor [bacterium]|nr:TonB-dependent receptor [bacterium]
MIKRLIAASLLLALFCTTSPALAGTTGSLKGQITDAQTHAPIAGATVSAVSASQSATVTTDASGTYVFISLAPDTYTVSVAHAGYDTQSIPGQSIFADQTSALNVPLAKTLKTIAKTRASASSFVRSGTTSDVYSVNAAGQQAARALGGSGSLDQAYSAIASVPGVSIPTGQQGWYQSVFIRGGDYDQVAYEFDGIPVLRESDGAPITTLSVLGQQEVQVYTGGTPATSDSPGLAGYINQVIKTGTYPGYGTASIGIGAPTFYHKLSVEAGGASPDRTFSYYVGIAGANTAYRYGDQFNAVSDPLYYYPLTIPTTNSSYNILDGSCNNVTLAPGQACDASIAYGAQFSPGSAWTQATNEDRESIVNFHFAIPHKHDAGRDDLQMLYVTGNILTSYYASANDIGAPQMSFLDANVANGGGYYTGAVFGAPDPNAFSSAQFPSAQEIGLNQPIPVNQRDGGSNGYSIEKLQYQRNINERSYLRAIGYSEYTNWFLNGPNSANQLFGATLADYEVLGHVYGGSLIYSNSLSDKHLLTGSVSYQTQKLQTYNATFDPIDSTGQFGSVFTNLTDGSHCYDPGSGTYTSCYSQTVFSPGMAVPTIDCAALAGTPACTNNAQFRVTENGQNAQVDNVTPKFSSIALTDSYRPNDKLTINAGARFDHFAYVLDNLAAGYPARQFWFNAYNNEHCSALGLDNVLGTLDPNTGALTCPTGYTAMNTPGYGFVNSTGGTTSQNVFQPRLAATYVLNSTTVLRGSIGVYARPAATSYHEYNTYQQDLPSFMSQFSALGYLSPDHNVRADTSTNADFSYEHRFPKSGLSVKLSPFYRTTNNQLQYLAISALGGTLAGINVGTLRSYGLEFAAQFGDFSRDGLSGMFSYTYTNTHTRYKSLDNGLNIVDVLNSSIEQYNSYTSACAANENTAQCGKGLYAANGAASFNNNGVTVANPYYSSAPQPLMDPGGSYVPYDVIPSAFASGNSYAVPDVASLVLNYKRGKFAITPSFSYNSGSYYGSPLAMPGYVPQGCTQDPAATPNTPGVSCGSGGAVFVPDPYTGKFDGFGTLREPSQLVMNLQMSYQVNPRMKLTVIANNLYNKCFQRGYAWDTNTACWYSSLPSNALAPNGPGTQPGAFLATPPVQLAYPYGIWFNNTQVGVTSARQPFQLTVDLDIKL